jgi:hypothetical protein
MPRIGLREPRGSPSQDEKSAGGEVKDLYPAMPVISDAEFQEKYYLGDETIDASKFNGAVQPCMPAFTSKRHGKRIHRERIRRDELKYMYTALVARPVSRAEMRGTKEAWNAMQTEWDRLQERTTWNIKKVQPWAKVAREANAGGYKVHVGNVFGICLEKHSELPDSDDRKKFKGRFVFGGDFVRDQNHNNAMFEELGSSPPTMSAGRSCVLNGMQSGHSIESADAVQAYTQCKLKGTPTWVRLPEEFRPKEWDNIIDPVCPLELALYGHPDAGG